MNIDPRYPIGKFERPEEISATDRDRMMQILRDVPSTIAMAVEGLKEEQLDTPYRDGGWTVRQVVHHVADSHMNAYIRFKLALTEDNPTIKPYVEALWAELPEAKTADVTISLLIIQALHERWLMMLKNMKDEEWQRTFFHPQYERVSKLDATLALYTWHGEHHIAHITFLRKSKGW